MLEPNQDIAHRYLLDAEYEDEYIDMILYDNEIATRFLERELSHYVDFMHIHYDESCPHPLVLTHNIFGPYVQRLSRE